MTRRRRAKAQGDKTVQAWLLGGIVGVIVLGLIVTSIIVQSAGRRVDRTNGCPTDHYDSVTVVLIDLTDKMTPVQAAAFKNTLLKVRADVPKFGRLEIYPLTSVATSTLQPIFVGCSPGSGREVDSKYYGNPELADRIWQKAFGSKLDAVAAEVLTLPEAANSPIFEGIQSVAVTAFGNPVAQDAKQKALIIISDLIQHTSDLSMYQGAPKFDHFHDGQYFVRVKPLLRGADVDVHIIARETKRNVQNSDFLTFWQAYFIAGGGSIRLWEPLQ